MIERLPTRADARRRCSTAICAPRHDRGFGCCPPMSVLSFRLYSTGAGIGYEFVDIDQQSLCMDPARVLPQIEKVVSRYAGVLFVH